MRGKGIRRSGAVAAVALLTAGLVSGGVATAVPENTGTHEQTRKLVDGLVEAGAPGAMVYAAAPAGEWSVHSGTARLGTDRPIRPGDKARVASNTKMFVAVTILQLAAQGRLGLDDPIDRHLPGLVQGNGYDGSRITLRQLAQHTGGVADYVGDVFADPSSGDHPWRPEDLVRLGLSHPPTFEPGTGWSYSNTGYVLLGMVIERVTGNDLGRELDARIIRPLGLRHTEYPDPGERRIIGPHVHGYGELPGRPFGDVTEMEPSIPGAAGSLVSTGPDMTTMVRALLDGDLLPPDMLDAMRATVPADGTDYGLGLRRVDLPCGGEAWGHTGNIPGYDSLTLATEDGRSVFVLANGPRAAGGNEALGEAAKSALCEGG